MFGPLEAPPREIALVRLSALGDVIPALPVANALKRAFPEARLTWLIQPLPYRLIYNHPAVDNFLMFHRWRGASAWRSILGAARELKGRRFDLVLDLQTAFKAGLVTGLLNSPVKVGVDLGRARELNWLFTTHRLPPRPLAHFQDEYLEFVEFLGIDPHPVEWGIRFTEEEEAERRSFFERLGGPACAVVVGTSRAEKNWAPERYARLLEALEGEFGFRCFLLGGPSAVERRIADRILAETRAKVVDALGDDVRRLACLLGGSDLVVSPDTGPLHIARALDVPVVGLYGYTNPLRWGPYRKYQELVVDGYARYPGEPYVCSREHRRGGMERVTVAGVVEKVALAVERYVAPRRGGRAD
jgi:heptosyltransferase I